MASSTVQAVSADHPPAQLAQIQALVETYKDQISRHPDDFGQLTEKYEDFYMIMPTQEGAS